MYIFISCFCIFKAYKNNIAKCEWSPRKIKMKQFSCFPLVSDISLDRYNSTIIPVLIILLQNTRV